ncbi:MAG TPA: hypothetical protein PLL33_07460, partial [Paracoccus sp. (in: a-proteobacteria)]|nr:hypothetical protein [Paracoccus sp. (in: a-proteobacteria)]
VTVAGLGIDDIESRARLRRAMLPQTLPEPLAEPVQADQPQGQDDTLLILDHDLADADLRDVLRRLGPHAPGPLRLHLLRPRLTAALRNGVEGAAREIAAGLSLTETAIRIGTPACLPGRIVFARSSTLFQFDTRPLFAAEADAARVMVLDPIGTAMAEPAARADRFSRDLLPFALSMRGPAFFELLAQVPQCFLTEEARLRLLVETLIARDGAELQRADIYRFFEGKSGPCCQNFADGRDWHAYDAESRRLIQENRAA